MKQLRDKFQALQPYLENEEFKPEKIGQLVALSKTASHIFPLTEKVADFFKDGAVVTRLIEVREKVAALYTFEENSPLMVQCREVIKARFDEAAAKGAK